MADAVAINQLMTSIPGTTDTGYMLLYGLHNTMKSAGWTVVQSSDGTTFGAADYWGAMSTTGGSWIVLQGPGSRQICFWVNTTFDMWTGKIIYARNGDFSFSGATATSPGTIPATAQYIRGSGAAFASWFSGGTKAIRYAQILCKDVSDGSFWVIGSTPLTASGTFCHHMAFMSLNTLDASDTDPYVFYTAGNSPTADSPTNYAGQQMNISLGENGTTSGYWWGWARNNSWRSFSTRYDYLAGTNGDVDPYAGGTTYILHAVGICKTENNWREHKGYLKFARTGGVTGMVPGDTISNGASLYQFTMVGSNNGAAPQMMFFWDGTTAGMTLV